jgi:peptidoglycan-associated lipoprotein
VRKDSFRFDSLSCRLQEAALVFFLLAVAAATVSCGRRPPPAAPPAAPPPAPTVAAPGTTLAAPELQVRLEPDRIQKGESALLVWDSVNTDYVAIDQEIGNVDASGRIRIFPEVTTTYRVTAVGPGGQTTRSATIEISDALTTEDFESTDLDAMPLEEQFGIYMKPIFFQFDSAELSDEARLTLDGNLRWLAHPGNSRVRFVIEGHSDERGTEEYNLALGDKRAQVVKLYLVSRGVNSDRILTVSFGEEQPFDTRQNEEAWASNRRAHFVLLRD